MNAVLLFLLFAFLSGCSLREVALNQVGNALAEGGAAFSSDDDPQLVRDAAPFSLKLMESLLVETPRHAGLLLAATRGFTQYAYAFVQQEAEESEAHDLLRARRLEERARRLYLRARDYGRRGLALREDAALLYWTGAAWLGYIGLSKDRPEALAELPQAEALIDRALALDEAFERGAIHSFLVGYEPVRPGAAGDRFERARRHFARAVELSAAREAAPFVALAESVCVPQQRRAEFEALLHQALAIDTRAPSEGRLANLIAQRRARWLLSRIDHLFLP